MTVPRTRTPAKIAALLLAIALAALPAAAYAQEGDIRLQTVDAEGYPDITLTVVLPADRFDPTGPIPGFAVDENGRKAQVADVTALGREREPLDVVLLLDISGSMAGEPLLDAKAAARGFIHALGPDDQVALIAFNATPRVVAPFGSDRTATERAMAPLEGDGGTALYDAVRMAADLLATRSADTPRTVVVLADGADGNSTSSLDDAVRAAVGTGVPLYTVALETGDFDPAPLQTLANATGGRSFSVDDSGLLLERFEAIAAELQNVYAVTFQSREPNTMELELDVTATLDGQSTTLATAIENPRFGQPVDVIDVLEEYRVAARTDPVMLLVTVVLFFAATALLVLAASLLLARTRTGLADLEFYDQVHSRPTDAGDASGDDKSLRGRMIEAIAWVAGRRGLTQALSNKLEQAGLPLRALEYMYLHIMGVVTIGFVSQILTGSLLTSVVMVLIAVAGPLLALEVAIERRRTAFEEQLPEILSLISGSIRSGWGLLQSLDLVVKETSPPASLEFRRVEAEARLGLPLDEALDKMADRLGSEDFRWVVVAINIQREVGGNLAEVLDILADTMRDRAELKRHIRALTAEGRLSGIILYALPVLAVLTLSIVNPSYMADMFSHPVGVAMLFAGVGLLVVGGVWLARVIRVEV